MKESNCKHHHSSPCPKKVHIFETLSDEEIVKVARMTNHTNFKKGETLLHEGEKADTLFIVHKGQVKVCKYTIDGKEQILYILSTGEFFGELHLFNKEEGNNFSVSAIEDTEICMLTKENMEILMKENPEISIKLIGALAKRLAHTENLAQNLATKDPEIRIVHMILEFCQKFGKKREEGILIELPITREEIASYVGVTRETISRKFSKFEDLGLITLLGTRQLYVRNLVELEDYIQ